MRRSVRPILMGIGQVEANICAIAPPAPPENDGIGSPGRRRPEVRAMRDFLSAGHRSGDSLSAFRHASCVWMELIRRRGVRPFPANGEKNREFPNVRPYWAKTPQKTPNSPKAYERNPYAIGTGNSFGRTGNSFYAIRGKQGIVPRFARDAPRANSIEDPSPTAEVE